MISEVFFFFTWFENRILNMQRVPAECVFSPLHQSIAVVSALTDLQSKPAMAEETAENNFKPEAAGPGDLSRRTHNDRATCYFIFALDQKWTNTLLFLLMSPTLSPVFKMTFNTRFISNIIFTFLPHHSLCTSVPDYSHVCLNETVAGVFMLFCAPMFNSLTFQSWLGMV